MIKINREECDPFKKLEILNEFAQKVLSESFSKVPAKENKSLMKSPKEH